MDIKRLILEELLLEYRIAELTASIVNNFTVRLDIEDTKHYNARKHRHEFVGKNTMVPLYIDDTEVISILEKAKRHIAGKIVSGAIRNGKDFVLADKTGVKKIVLVIAPRLLENDKTRWELTIVTIFSELAAGRPFTTRDNQLLIKV